MNLPKLLCDFQVKINENFAKFQHLLGRDYTNWFHFKQLIIIVANKIENSELFPECMSILMTHEFKPRIWDAGSFVLILNYIDPQLTKMFFCIINAVINHPNFGPYSVHFRKNCQIKLGYKPLQFKQFEYVGFEFYDALVEINAYFMKLIPVHRPMPFFQSRLPLYDFDVAQCRNSSLNQMQKMLVISGISRLLIRKLCFLKVPEHSSQMKTILLQNF